MKNLVSFLILFFLTGIVSLTAQINQTQNVTFETTKQSIFDPNPAFFKADTFRLLHDNGVDASFFVPTVDVDAMIHDPNLGDTGFEVLAKFGMNFDMYARYLINSGSADIKYPVEIKFTKPNDGNYGCSQEVKINTSYSLKPGYQMTLGEPEAEFAMGTELDAGFFGGARACFVGFCDEAGEDHGNPTFRTANENNYHNYLVNGNYDYLRISSSDGLQFPWDLVPLIPTPPGVIQGQYSLPYHTTPDVEANANISGTLDQPFRNFDRPDQLMGQAIVDKGSHMFMDLEFDPIQFQEHITHIPLTFSVDVGRIHMDFAILSIPFIFQNSFYHEMKFDPKVKANLNLGRPLEWKEMKGNNLVQSGNSQLVSDFTVGNDLVLTLADNNPVNIVPTALISNQFTTKLDIVFDAAVAFRLMAGSVTIDGLLPTDPPFYEKEFAGLNEQIPLGSKVNTVLNKTFEMGGFNTAILNSIELHPDVTPPVLVTKPINAYIPDAGGFVTINPQDVVLSAMDGQGGAIRYLSVTPNTFDCSKLGPNIVTVTIDDSRCNTTTATAIVTVIDRTKPNVACKPANAYLNGAGQAFIVTADVFQTGSDNCGILNLESISKSSFNCGNIGANQVVLTVNDGHGNANTCAATVNVIDNIAPSVTCQPTTVYLDALGNTIVSPASIFKNGSDNCGVVNLTNANPGAFNCSQIGDNLVTLTVNDGHGNTATCTATVTVLDKIAPTVVCKPATVDLNANGAGSINTANVFQSGVDNCGVVNQESVLPNTFDCSKLGANTVVLTVNDSHGNTNTCTATVTVRDLIKPVATCPANISRANDLGVCGASVSYTASASDNCSIASLVPVPASGSLFNIGTTQVKYTATDIAGNTGTCTFTVTVTDTESPVLTCPANVNLENEPGKCSATAFYADATATDNCAVQKVERIDGRASGLMFPVGVSYITYRATDIYGNSSTCSFSVEIRDTEAPKLACPMNLTKPNDFGDCGRRMTNIGAPSQLSDNCGVYGVTNNSPVNFPIGETAVIWTITDIHANTASCVQTVTIFDQDWPNIVCPQNMKVKTDEGYCEASNVAFNATATDNCPGVTLEYDHEPNYLFPVGYTNVEARATDVYGHESTCMFQVIVETRPEICNGIDDDCDGIADEIQEWKEIFRAEAANGQANAQLGTSVAIDGDWALVGAPGSGHAYILRRSDSDPSDWVFVTEFDNGSNYVGDLFGQSVSLQNGIAAVGAPEDGTKANDAGAVHIYVQNTTDPAVWTKVKTVFASDAAEAANFGKSLKVKGQTLLVGATGAGAAYVFGQNEGGAHNWGQAQKLIASDANAGSEFGLSLDFDQQTAVVGAPNEGAGAVYVFDPANGWLETQKIQPASGDAGDRFGHSLSLDGKRLVVGAPADDDKGENAGAAYVFGKNQNGAFVQQSKILDVTFGTTGDEFGYSVSVRGDYLAVGAPADDLRGKDAGAVHMFLREDGGWISLLAITQQGSRPSDHFGQSLQLQPGSLIAGTPGDDIGTQMNRGSAAIFEGLCSPSDAGQRESEQSVATAEMTLSPNPASGQTSVQFALPADQAFSIRAYDMSGRLVLSHDGTGQLGSNSFPLNLTNFADGVYVVDFQTERTSVQKRLVVQKD